MAHQPTAPTDTDMFLFRLPYRSKQRDDDNVNLDVSVWRRGDNRCELKGLSNCETASGLYYGSAEDEVTKFCPRHYFEMHFGPNAAYKLTELAQGPKRTGSVWPKAVTPLPFRLEFDGEVWEEVWLWRCDNNACEMSGDGWCDGTGYFYGLYDNGAPVFCARHYFDLNSGGETGGGHRLLDTPPDEYRRELVEAAAGRLRWATEQAEEALKRGTADVRFTWAIEELRESIGMAGERVAIARRHVEQGTPQASPPPRQEAAASMDEPQAAWHKTDGTLLQGTDD